MLSLTLSAAVALSLPDLINAYSWQWQSVPNQCGNIDIQVSGGSPPYRVLIIPSGSSPLPNNIEVRKIIDQPSDSSSISFKLPYPADSQFVAVVSDSTGFGSGGASAAINVADSNDSSCFDASQNVQGKWFFNLDPPQQIVQCQPTRIWWTPGNVTGQPTFFGVIPQGNTFVIPVSNVQNEDGTGTGFNWTTNIRSGTTLHIIANDNTGNGTGGSSRNTVLDSLFQDSSCLSSNSPTTTSGPVAGGSLPDGSGGGSSSSSGGGTNTGAIVGGVIGGVVLIIAVLLALFFWRRRNREHRTSEKRQVDLLQAEAEDDRPGRQELPQYYQPEPFIVPDPSSDTASYRMTAYTDAASEGRPLSTDYDTSSRSGTPDPSGAASSSVGTRKTAPRTFRPVNIIQHDDAGPSEQGGKEEEPETIELPPAYTNIRK
ncbi:hypothetical protein D9758_003079 [Tetrapyrgos nigripes]|uniref:Uncharacterized protein n=1 Tax=Tetrapyrgos nigripes TaxID=182062 RepID=A0A8H5LTT7_9AGAR|nr:hypothetical protein D9758_003079 [Tetrapyrgos nigripes]